PLCGLRWVQMDRMYELVLHGAAVREEADLDIDREVDAVVPRDLGGQHERIAGVDQLDRGCPADRLGEERRAQRQIGELAEEGVKEIARAGAEETRDPG